MTKEQMFSDFITENMNRTYRFAYTYTKNEALAEDVVGESIVKALQSLHSLKNEAYLKTWFYRIIINTALAQIKKEKRRSLYHQEAAFEEMDKGSEDRGTKIVLQEMLDLLDPKYKSIVVLRYFEDMTLQEIAEVLQENVNTIKTRLYRALKLLRIEMEEEL